MKLLVLISLFFFSLKLTSLSLVDSAVCLLMSLSLFPSSSITQLLVQCWLPLSFPLVPFSKKIIIIMPPSSLYFILSFSSQKQHTRAPNPQSTALGFTQSDMVVQPSPTESHTSDFLLTCNSDLPSVLTWHLDCGSVSLPSAV